MQQKLSNEQNLILSQRQLLNLKILQLSTLDLKEYLEKEALENPVFEVDYKEASFTAPQSKTIKSKIDSDLFIETLDSVSLIDFIISQINMLNLDKPWYSTLIKVVSFLENDGYIKTPISEISSILKIDTFNIKKAIDLIKTLEPAGVGASNLQECLLLQTKDTDILQKNIIQNHLANISQNKIDIIAKNLKISSFKSLEIIDKIKSLNPLPGESFESYKTPNYITPDVVISKENDSSLSTYLPFDSGIDINLSKNYINLLKSTKDEEVKFFLETRILKATLYKKAIESRKSTILNITKYIAEVQADFLLKKQKHLNSLDIQKIAKQLNLHPTTISRAIHLKYVQTPVGIFPIKKLLTHSVNSENQSSDKILVKIKEIIDSENKSKPLSDEKISLILQNSGFDCSRRTISKYRVKLKIPTASQRKQF